MSFSSLAILGSASAQRLRFLNPLFSKASLSNDRPSETPGSISANPAALMFFVETRITKTVNASYASLDAIVLVPELPASSSSSDGASSDSSSCSWSTFCLSSGFGAFILVKCDDNMLSVAFLGTIGDTTSDGWSSIGVPGSEFSIPAPEFVQCASMQLLNNFPDIVETAKSTIARIKPSTGGGSSEDRFATGIGAALSPFIAQQQHTLEILAKNASIGSTAKEYDRSRLASLQGIVDNPNQFFALFSPPSSLEGVNGDAGVGGGGDGGADGVPAQVPSAKHIDRHSFFVAIRSKLASTTGITQRPFDLSDKALWDLFGILDFGPGGNADICQFVRKGESVSSPQELQAALENYASFIQQLGFVSLGKAIFNFRRALITLAGQNPRAVSLAVQLQISKNQLSLPFGKHASRFAPGSVHQVSLEDSLRLDHQRDRDSPDVLTPPFGKPHSQRQAFLQ